MRRLKEETKILQKEKKENKGRREEGKERRMGEHPIVKSMNIPEKLNLGSMKGLFLKETCVLIAFKKQIFFQSKNLYR